MNLPAKMNGATLPEGAYLYQTIHILRGEGLHLEEHIALLEQASRRWFGRSADLAAGKLRQFISTFLTEARCPAGVSSFVRLRLYESGDTILLPGGTSLYSGYAFRSIFPAAATVSYDLPFDEAPLSAREHAAFAARRLAVLDGAQTFVRTDSRREVRSCDDAPLFAVRGKEIFTPDRQDSVEFAIAAAAIRSRGYRLHTESIAAECLSLFEELFYCDHRGITALGSCDGRLLMHVIAEQVAAQLR